MNRLDRSFSSYNEFQKKRRKHKNPEFVQFYNEDVKIKFKMSMYFLKKIRKKKYFSMSVMNEEENDYEITKKKNLDHKSLSLLLLLSLLKLVPHPRRILIIR